MKNWIKNLCVLVTGASSGIGKEFCKTLINEYNCTVIGVARNEDKLLNVQKEIEEEFGKKGSFLYLVKDVSKKESWKDIFNFAKQKNVRLVINNAGTMLPFLKASKIEEEQVERIFKTNFYSVFYSLKAFDEYFKNLKEDCGIVNITSSASNFLIPGQSVYSASKSAVTKLSLIASSEARKDYFIGTYLPGLTDTNIFFSSDNKEEILKGEKIKKICKKLGTTPNKVATKILRLTNKKKRYKVLGKDSKALKLLQCLLNIKSSDFIFNIFNKTKEETFKNIF